MMHGGDLIKQNQAVWLWLALLITSCQDSFMKQNTVDKMGAVSNLQTSLDDAGNFIAEVDPTKTETQLMRITEGTVAGAAVAIPPSSLSIPVSIMVGEGVPLTTNSFSRDLGLTGNAITAGGPSVSFATSQDVVATSPLTLSIPYGALAFPLADVNTENLVVMYRWMTLKDGEPSYEVGVIPGDKVTRGTNKVSFQTTKFGTFQVGLAETKISKPLLAATQEPPALKSCERYAAAVYPTCTEDGQVGCLTTESFKAVDMKSLQPGKILINTKIAGVTGTANNEVAACSDSRRQDCIATGNFFASTPCTENSDNCFIPKFETPNKNLKAINFASIDPTKMLTTLSIAGQAGTIADIGQLTSMDPNNFTPGYYRSISSSITGSSSTPECDNDTHLDCLATIAFKAVDSSLLVPGNIRKTVTMASIDGTLERPDNCSSDGQTSCVVDPATTFTAMNKSGAENIILDTKTLGGVDGKVTLPDPKNVLKETPNYGDPSNPQTPSLAIDLWDLRAGINTSNGAGMLKVSCKNRAPSNVAGGNSPTYQGNISAISPAQITVAVSFSLYEGQPVQLSGALTGSYFAKQVTSSGFTVSSTAGPLTEVSLSSTSLNLAVIITTTGTGGGGFDTVDDGYWLTTDLSPSNSNSPTDCYGIGDAASDNVWLVLSDQSPSRLQDKISGLYWQYKSVAQDWGTAKTECTNLNVNGETDWRLPTQKELMQAYTHGIISGKASAGLTPVLLDSYFWSNTSPSISDTNNTNANVNGNLAWVVNLARGSTKPFPKDTSTITNQYPAATEPSPHTICVK